MTSSRGGGGMFLVRNEHQTLSSKVSNGPEKNNHPAISWFLEIFVYYEHECHLFEYEYALCFRKCPLKNMRPTMELGKYIEDPGSCIDRISNLPDELLGHMLSFLPTRHAVRTSILSTRWRYLYTFTTILSFDDAPCFDDLEDYEIIEDNSEIIAATRRFKEFVDKVLELHQVSRIKKFSLICEGNYDNLDLDRWVSNALQKGVQELHINGIGCLPDGVFMCGTLVSLKIKCFEFKTIQIQIPLSTLLPKLKILHLHRIMFFDVNSMERLLSSCELLEELTLKCCKYASNSSILVPNGFVVCRTLLRLKIRGCIGNQIGNPLSASLPEMKILHLDDIIFYDFNSMERLFTSCGLLEELTLIYCKCDTRGFAIHSTETLKVLTIRHCSFLLGTYEIDAPNLANLTYHSNIGVKIVPSWRNSCSFDKAKLVFKCNLYDGFFLTNMDSYDYDSELLKAAAYKATELRFEKDSVKILLALDDDEQMPDFPSLSRLHLRDCPFDAWKYVTSLIDKSPQLETVIFESGFCFCICSQHDCQDDCYCNSSSRSDILLVPFSCHVQVIEVHRFCGHECSLSYIGHLLTNAGHLKRLIIHIIYSLDWEENRNIIRELLMLPRASRLCHVQIIFGPSRSRFVLKGNLEGKGADIFGLFGGYGRE
ncbi:hypothetical protein KSS87_019995 [Heliosperma pusillum]|nr:hypothetical protein KSS87_019995 [Heliosperma pusillum]